MKHFPVMLREAVDGLKVQPDGIYVDGTFGAGGHSREILSRLDGGLLYGFDRDPSALEAATPDPRLRLRHNNFSDMTDVLRADGITAVDGVLLDLGVSSMQFDEGERGFSYRFSADLDMRMNPESAFNALEVIRKYPAEDLQEIFSAYGEIRNAKTLAEAVVKERELRQIRTTKDLELLVLPYAFGNKMRYLSQVFQAVRMEVNQEIRELKLTLQRLEEVLKPGGRIVVITFHSLEDRLVKSFLKHGSFDNKPLMDEYGRKQASFKMLTKKPVLPGEKELRENKRSRSAKLRIGERLK